MSYKHFVAKNFLTFENYTELHKFLSLYTFPGSEIFHTDFSVHFWSWSEAKTDVTK